MLWATKTIGVCEKNQHPLPRAARLDRRLTFPGFLRVRESEMALTKDWAKSRILKALCWALDQSES